MSKLHRKIRDQINSGYFGVGNKIIEPVDSVAPDLRIVYAPSVTYDAAVAIYNAIDEEVYEGYEKKIQGPSVET